MIILVEGMDNTGKTTLSKRLMQDLHSASFNFEYFHNEKKNCRLEALETAMACLEVGRRKNIIMDRFIISGEYVYGRKLRGKSLFTTIETEMYMRFLSTLSVAQIYCKPPINVVLSNLGEREQMEGVVENAKELYNTYDSFFMNYWFPASSKVFLWNYASDDSERNYKALLGQIVSRMKSVVNSGVVFPVDLAEFIDDMGGTYRGKHYGC